MTLWDFFLHEKSQIALAAAAGGLVRWMALRDGWRSGCGSLLGGVLCAIYVGPAVFPLMEPALAKIVVEGLARQQMSGFVVGLGGMALAGFFIDLWTGIRARGTDAANPKPGGK